MSEHVQNRFQTLEQDNMGFISPNQPYELPEAPSENFGLMATVDLGGSLMKPEFYHAQDENAEKPSDSRFQMLLVVDLEAEGGSRWAEGADIPEGAKIAILDPKGMQTAEDGRIVKGIDFLSRGQGLIIGKDVPRSRDKFDIASSEAVSPKHIDIGVNPNGQVVIRDRGSLHGTIVGTGERAREAVNGIGSEYEHHLVFKQNLGEAALSQAVVEPLPGSAEDDDTIVISREDFYYPKPGEGIPEDVEGGVEIGHEQIDAMFQSVLASAQESAVRLGEANGRINDAVLDGYKREFADALRNNYQSQDDIARYIQEFKTKMTTHLDEFTAAHDNDPQGIKTILEASGGSIQAALESLESVEVPEEDRGIVDSIKALGVIVNANLVDGYASIKSITDTLSRRCESMMQFLNASEGDTLRAIQDIAKVLSDISNTDLPQMIRAKSDIDSAANAIYNLYRNNYRQQSQEDN